MEKFTRRSQKGQSLITVAVFLIALIAMLALILDGGNAYLKRRQAQNAADAGALAGARELCLGNPDNADDVAIEYAQDWNEATEAIPTILSARRIRVEASFQFDTFFGSILGLNQMTARALAEAGCYSPTYGEGVLPIVWSCRAPIEGYSDSTSCQQQRIDEDTLDDYLLTPNVVQPELYVVMDSESLNLDLNCIQDDPINGELDCDFDGDGEADWLAGGSRSWVDLDGTNLDNDCPGKGGGAGELWDWIIYGYDCELCEHTWIPTQTGVAASIFEAAYCRWLPETEKYSPCPDKYGLEKPRILIPVNDDFCEGGDPRYTPECDDRWHRIPPDDVNDVFNEGASNQTHYHIKTFAAFHITCVRLSENKPEGSCPGIELAKELNPGAFTGNDYKSIEGYFLEGYFSGIGGKGDPNIDTGVYTIFLDR